jgi:hypothetical protein
MYKSGLFILLNIKEDIIMKKELVERINKRLFELGLENYSWDISEIDDEVIQSLLEEHYREEE